MSKTNEEINRGSAGVAQWEACYNDFVTEANKRELDVENHRAAEAGSEYKRRNTQGATFVQPASKGK